MNTDLNRRVMLTLLGWFCLAISLAGWFHNASAPAVAATVWTLTVLVLLACWKITPIKVWALNVDVRAEALGAPLIQIGDSRRLDRDVGRDWPGDVDVGVHHAADARSPRAGSDRPERRRAAVGPLSRRRDRITKRTTRFARR